jgi:tRNA A37 methylthiotransferase MiaB
MKTYKGSAYIGYQREPLPADPTKLRIAIFAPPLVEAFQPSLTLPYLSAQMKSFGFSPNCHNLSSLFYIWLFRKVRLESMEVYRSMRHAMAVLRDSKRFYCINDYQDALKRLEDYVNILAKQDKIPYTLYPESQVSILSAGMDFSSILKTMENTLLDRFLMDYLGFTLQLEIFDVIGFSANNTFQLLSSIFIAKKLKQAKVTAHLVLGGHAVTITDPDILKDKELGGNFDMVVLSGGGDVLAQICDDIVNKKVKTIYKNLDVSSRYHQTKGLFPTESPYRLTLQHDINDLYLSPHQVFSIHSALGCNYGACIFCSSNRKSAPYVPRNIDVLVDEIEWLQEHYHIIHFNISDNNFEPDRADRLCDELEKRGRKIYWQCTSRVYDEYDKNLLNRMRENGCILINIGLESASDRILKRMKKGYTVGQIKQMLNNVKEVKMPVHLYCICGFPGETPDDSEQTVHFLKEHVEHYHSIYFQDYDRQLANKIFADELGTDTKGYSAAHMMSLLIKDKKINESFAMQGNLIRKKGYPFVEDHNFLYLAKEFGNLNKDIN